MAQYRPRRASNRWLQGAPEYVLSCHDNGGSTADRYTVYFGGSLAFDPQPDRVGCECTGPGNTPILYLGMSDSPTHPLGVSQWGECSAYDRAGFMLTREGRKTRWLDLPEDVRNHVIARATTP